MMRASEASGRDGGGTRLLLTCGAVAGPLYILAGLTQAFTREGFDVRRHALSLLANGDLGWIQTGNFVVSGLLVIAGAIGLRRALAGTRGGTWGPLLLAIYGLGLMGVGFFPADPVAGFPPGTPEPRSVSRTGFLHFVSGGIGFYAFIAASFVFARRFRGTGENGWALGSAILGAGFLASFVAIASGSTSSATILPFYFAVAAVCVWLALLHMKVLGETTRVRPPAVVPVRA